MSGEWEKWVPVLDSLVFQTYYRQLSWVSVHAPVDEVYRAAEHLAETKRGGRVYWVFEDKTLGRKVFRWDDLEVFPEIHQTNWFVGGPRNTAMARRGWWAMYLFDPMVKGFARVFGTWRPELERG